MDKWIDGWMYGVWLDECMNGMNGWMGWMDEWDVWMN
jgi:hypothetical protein